MILSMPTVSNTILLETVEFQNRLLYLLAYGPEAEI